MRALFVSDSIRLTTGFANVGRRWAVEMVRRGHEVLQLCGLDPVPAEGGAEAFAALGVTPYWTREDDLHGHTILPSVINIVKPDVVCFTQHPGGVGAYLPGLLRAGVQLPPYVLYAPLEGWPAPGDWLRAYARSARAFTCTKWGSDRLASVELPVPYVYHGVDRTTFKPLEQWRRNQLRKQLGWSEKFVVIYVARNAERKQHVRLLDALAWLVASGVTNVRLYLHCRKHEGFSLSGWDLGAEVAWRGLDEYVQFAEQERRDQGMPAAELAERMAAADLCVYPSALEGVGLPLIEAMAVGLPIAVTDDQGGNMTEMLGGAQYRLLDVADTTSWFNGARIHHVSQRAIAQCILDAIHDPAGLQRARERSLARAADPAFRWEPMEQALAGACEAVGARELVTV